MKLKIPANPFPTTGYYGPEYFCDREEESNKISQLLQNGQSCLLMGNRRLGKTALIHHVRQMLPKNWGFIYLDILSTENEQQLLNALGAALLQGFPEKSKVGKRVWDFMKSLHPTISFDQLSGIPQVSIHSAHVEKPIKNILEFLAQLEQPTVVAIDEFQQIAHYPEKNTDAWLRTVIQRLQNVYFLFSGSRQSILNELFSDPSRPFFRSASPLKIGKIGQDDYREFVVRHFKKGGKTIEEALVDEILEWAKCHTYYVQLLCNRLYQKPIKKYVRENLQSCADEILQEQEAFFIHYRTLLSPQQWKLLSAIARTGTVYAPTSKAFMSSNHLGSPATVFKSLDALLDKEMIFKEYGPEGEPYYEVYDVFFERWMQVRGL
ncbi:ATP-binding protein [Litoribacter alkaliphilus]|uniref:ATP-binding protein n=1 Tax=Litoribacter ruber TaxID=702568 RepID=A0AAP2CKM5_9BACT|nr:ATP-binding protein [Litoribacter alkaliphilus]MBS9525519.1 ATP-binding protein [Litoribacter alkaliphilus]